MMKKLLFLIATLYPTASFADAIELLGINLSMTLEEQQHALSQSGYECMEKKYPWGTTYFTCKNGEKEIVPSEEKIRFSCANFNACNLSLRELSQAVVDQKIVLNGPEFSRHPRSSFSAAVRTLRVTASRS